MAVTYRTGITILQFVFFVPALALSVLLCIRQGMKAAASSWRFIVVLSLLRLASDIAYFISLFHPTVSAIVTVIVCDLMGLAPLTLACVGLLGRVNEISNLFQPKFFAFISFISLAGLITGVVGATLAVDTDENSASYSVTPTIKAALALFIATFGLMVASLALLGLDALRNAHKRAALGRETRILLTVAAATPFLLVRLVYACIADFNGDPRFNLFDGDDTIYLCMGVLMEIIVTTICLTAGYLVPPPPPRAEGEVCLTEGSRDDV